MTISELEAKAKELEAEAARMRREAQDLSDKEWEAWLHSQEHFILRVSRDEQYASIKDVGYVNCIPTGTYRVERIGDFDYYEHTGKTKRQ